ncbi:MAG: carboxypeptidase-like regulatory domain-containing protein [Acidobacteriia bacterium]|nr:carboxypeptidase-like regulatory domain-containing protein [Terriglobia bacterium]
MKVLAFMGLFGIAALLPAQNTVTIEGVVVDAVTNAGIGGANVQLIGSGPYIGLTDEAGVFRFTGLHPGDYIASAEKPGYLGRAQFPFHIGADGSPVQPRLKLLPPATLRGRVLGIDGKPARATVDLGPYRGIAQTNDDGYFTFDQLPPGSFTLLARPDIAESTLTQEGLRTTALVPTYYPSSLERSQAESITIRAGVELSGYEIRLQSSPVYRVSGVVLDLDGNPAADAVVQLFDRGADGLTAYNGRQVFSIRRSSLPDTFNATQSTTTGDDGTFEFPSVWPGDWIVRVESDLVRDEIHQRDVILFGSETISLGRRDLDDLKIQLRMPFDFSGTVDDGDASPSIAGSVAVTLTGETGYFGGTIRPDIDGRLRFEGVIPGRYLISTEAAGNYYAAALLGSSDVTGKTVELTVSSPPMRVVLKHGGTVRWTLDQSGSWAVVLWPQTLTGIGYSISSPLTTSQLTGIPPGTYYAIALDRFDVRTMADTPHLRELVPRATSVHVDEGLDTFVQLKINHAPD